MSNNENLVTCGCQIQGLAILPVRYTAVPCYIEKTKPSWANLDGVTTIPLNEDYQYHIRKVKAGFIYIYLPSGISINEVSNSEENLSEEALIEQEKKYWLVYSIDENARFVKQSNIQQAEYVDQNDEAFMCPNLVRDQTLCSFITIPNPDRYEKIYLAYSQFKLTAEALREYRQNPIPRMQEINVKKWQTQQQQMSATVATEETLTQILDFDFDFEPDLQLINNQETNIFLDMDENENYQNIPIFDSNRPIFEKSTHTEPNKSLAYAGVLVNDTTQRYKFNENNLKFNSTSQPWGRVKLGSIMTNPQADTATIFKEMHNTHIKTLQKNMQKYSGSGTPMLLAVEDAFGVAEDLNGYYNDIYGHLVQFQSEARMECDVLQYMEKIRAFVESKVAKDDFDIAPYKDELYLALSRNLTLDNVDYKTQVLEEMMYKKNPLAYGMAKAYENDPRFKDYFALDIENQANIWGVDTNFDVTAPAKREFYTMVKSYILLVKNYFYGKPAGKNYYNRFMKYLKFNQDKADINGYSTVLQKDWSVGSIYEQVVKYSTFKQDASPAEIRITAQKLHQLYQKLVVEYEANAEKYKNEFDAKVDKELEKYTSSLDADDFDKKVVELNKQVTTIADKRAKQLINWLENSHYLNFINDLSFEHKVDITSDSPLWQKYKTSMEQELQEALSEEEITADGMDELKTINLNGFYFSSVLNAALQGLDISKAGQAFTQKLYNLEQLKDVDVESRVYIKTKFWVLGLRALCYDHKNTLKVLKDVFNAVEKTKGENYVKKELAVLAVDNLSFFTSSIRKATLALEYFTELAHLQRRAGLTNIVLDTSLGKKTFIIKWLANYNVIGFFPARYLNIYDNLITRCSPIGKGLYSMGAMIAEAATLAISGVVWKTATVYAHLKYQLMEAWIAFKSQNAAGVNIGGGFKLLSSAYSAQAKHLIKQLRDSLNTAIKQLDKRFIDQLVDIDLFFKKTLNISFQVFSDATTKFITRKQIQLRSARLAFLVGAFEVYNWNYVRNKEPSLFANDSDILMEKMIATSSLFAAISDMTASSIRIINGKTTAFAYAKVSFGIFGGAVGFLAGIHVGKGALEHWQRGNYLAGFLGIGSSLCYFTSGGLSVMLGLSYRFAWVQTFFEKRLTHYAIKQGLQKTFNLFALRFLLLRFAGVIGIIAFALELLYDYFSDNEIQVFLSYSALGKYKAEHKFKISFDQAEAFKAIEMLKAEIEEKTGKNISKLQKDAIEKIQLEHESIILKTEHDALQWVL